MPDIEWLKSAGERNPGITKICDELYTVHGYQDIDAIDLWEILFNRRYQEQRLFRGFTFTDEEVRRASTVLYDCIINEKPIDGYAYRIVSQGDFGYNSLVNHFKEQSAISYKFSDWDGPIKRELDRMEAVEVIYNKKYLVRLSRD